MVISTMNASAADGKSLYGTNGCGGCHGAEGAGSDGPRLAGQQKKYLVAQFILIRDKKRTTGLTSMMAPAVQNVSDDDIKAIADYLSGL